MFGVAPRIRGLLSRGDMLSKYVKMLVIIQCWLLQICRENCETHWCMGWPKNIKHGFFGGPGSRWNSFVQVSHAPPGLGRRRARSQVSQVSRYTMLSDNRKPLSRVSPSPILPEVPGTIEWSWMQISCLGGFVSFFCCFPYPVQAGTMVPELVTLWLFNIAMENCLFRDGLPSKNGWIFPWLC